MSLARLTFEISKIIHGQSEKKLIDYKSVLKSAENMVTYRGCET